MACFQVAISAPSHYKYKLIIKFYNGVFGISLNRHLKQTDVAHSIIFSRTEKFNATFIHKVWFGFQFSAKFFVENCLWRFSTKFGLSFPLSLKIFHLQISLIFLRKNRSEAFCGSSENILCATFCSYKKLRTSYTDYYKYSQNFDSAITNSDKSQA